MISTLCIFDLDGTLLNTISDLGNACNFALRVCGLPIHHISEYPHLVGNGVRKLIYRALPDDRRTDSCIDNMMQHFIPYYNEHNCVLTTPYDGIPELLQQLKKQGINLAVASNKYQQATDKIVNHFFPDIFDIACGENPPRPRKPDPQIVKNIQRSFPGCERTLYIGDSAVDILTARNAGIPVIACTWGFSTREEIENTHPDFIVEQPAEILRLI